MKSDTIDGFTFTTAAELGQLLRSYMPYYNGVRLHSGIGYRSPMEYETQLQRPLGSVYETEARFPLARIRSPRPVNVRVGRQGWALDEGSS